MTQRLDALGEANGIHLSRQYAYLAIITLCAALLRFYRLGEWSFWGDELITVRRALAIVNDTSLLRPFSLYLIQIPLTTFGVSEWSARLVPAIIGVITIPALYFPIRRIFNPTVGLISALLLALSPWHLYWSQNARFYTVLLLLYTLALFALYLGIEEDRPWYLVLSLLLFGLSSLERFTSLFYLPVIGAYLAILWGFPSLRPKGFRTRNLLLLILPGTVLLVAFSLPFVQRPDQFIEQFGWVNDRINNNPFWIISGVFFYLGIPIICMAFLGGIDLLRHRARIALLLGLGALIPLTFISALSPFLYTANRYTFVALTSWILLASHASREVIARAPKGARILAFGVILILGATYLSEDVLYYRFQNGNRDNWKAAFAWIDQRRAEDDWIVSANPEMGKFYLDAPDRVLGMEGLDPSFLAGSSHRVWFVEDLNVRERWPTLLAWVRENGQQVANFDVHVRARNFRMRVYLYQPSEP